MNPSWSSLATSSALLGVEDDGIDWPVDHPLGRKANQLEEGLQCPICCDFFDNPHMLIGCGHSFCSLCIRKHFDAKLNPTNYGSCPTCRKKSEAADLRKNVALSAAVEHYQAVRSDFFALFRQSLQKKSSHIAAHTPTVAMTVVKAHRGEPIVQRVAHFHAHGANKERLKKHIEMLTQKSRIPLRTDGDKDVLEKRIRELTHQINAQLDANDPLTLDEVIAKVNQNERALEEELRRSSRRRSTGNEDKFAELAALARESKKRKVSAEDSGVAATPASTLAHQEGEPLSSAAQDLFPTTVSNNTPAATHTIVITPATADESAAIRASLSFASPMNVADGTDDSPRNAEFAHSLSSSVPTNTHASSSSSSASAYASSLLVEQSSVMQCEPSSSSSSSSSSAAIPVASSSISLSSRLKLDKSMSTPANPTPAIGSNNSSAVIDIDAEVEFIQTPLVDSHFQRMPTPQSAPASVLKRGQWSCSACTLINDRSLSRCKACDTARAVAEPMTRRSARQSLKQQQLYLSPH